MKVDHSWQDRDWLAVGDKSFCMKYVKSKFHGFEYINMSNQESTMSSKELRAFFDANEMHRVQRRVGILLNMGYKSDYPLALWSDRTIFSTKEIGIEPPNTYGVWKHANCTGCIKAGKQHWFLVYKHRRDLFEKAKDAEEKIGYSIMKNQYLDEVEQEFELLINNGVDTTEHEDGRTFAARCRKLIKTIDIDDVAKPCECTL